MEKFRIQLSDWELRILRNQLAENYHRIRNNLRHDKNRVKHGESECRTYTIAEQEKTLRKYARLLKKLSRHIGDKSDKWFYY